ncbi:SDR family NAD(P)-dependent oxidoreductase [Agromyces seonyuensis]|uniref:3beta-hydroxysteroid 3-dehydrogenase n=1 Tax=Agromyces seonyuensis TaxID=2662446 RepID=A0A6I4NW04_9MICO|nr:SDR family NAD(P)-dependent oxidoreductase [Agromyces seonyuensis]
MPDTRPDRNLAARRAAVIGATAGVGFFTAAGLTAQGFDVTLTGRSPRKLDAAVRAIRTRHPDARLDTLVMDQSDPAAVSAGTAVLAASPLEVLVLNAGVVHTPKRRETTPDGVELVFATNVLGHQRVLAGALPALEASAADRWTAPRVVWLGSLSTRFEELDFADLELESDYTGWKAYARSKVAVETLGFELDRRLRARGSRVASVVAHPGYSIGGRTPRVPGVNEPSTSKRFADALQAWAQGKDDGARAVVHAATAIGVEGGDYWGPRFLTRGEPARGRTTAQVRDRERGARLWRAVEARTGVSALV